MTAHSASLFERAVLAMRIYDSEGALCESLQMDLSAFLYPSNLQVSIQISQLISMIVRMAV